MAQGMKGWESESKLLAWLVEGKFERESGANKVQTETLMYFFMRSVIIIQNNTSSSKGLPSEGVPSHFTF